MSTDFANMGKDFSHISPIVKVQGHNLGGTSQNFMSRQHEGLLQRTEPTPVKQAVTFPFKREYELVFHDCDIYRIMVDASESSLTFLLASLQDHKMWKGEYQAEYLEDISRKTGRELSFLQFMQMLNEALISQERKIDS